MVKNEVLVIFFAFFLVYTLVEVNSKIVAKLRNIECFPDSDWINMTCSLKAVSWKKSLVNIESELKQDLTSIMVHGQIFKRYNSYQPVPLKADFEFCSILGGNSNNNFYVPFVRKLINNYTNLNHTCPYNKGEKIFAKDLDWTPSDLLDSLLVTGDGRYRLDLNIYGNGAETKLARIVGYGDLTEE